MIYSRFHNSFRALFALVATALLLPTLAFADDQRGVDRNHERPWGYWDEFRWHARDAHGDRDRCIATVPDGGPGIPLLIATVCTILIFSPRPAPRRS
jgi:hypothetical protein